jgi:hypothetical protein
VPGSEVTPGMRLRMNIRAAGQEEAQALADIACARSYGL